MQKFTRPITREIDLGGQRLALTFSEQGMAVRPVGSRKPPREVSWSDLMTHVLGTEAPAPRGHAEPPPPPNPLTEQQPVAAGAGAEPASHSLNSQP